jgi:pimeloyl-ACP methyl ester carboxylesterase
MHFQIYEGETTMPKVRVNNITMHYDQQGSGEALILIPYLAADYACYAFQVAEYAKHFTCFSLDLRGTGETDKPEGTHTIALYADDVAAFMRAVGVEKAHVFGMSLGAAVGLSLAARYPETVASLSLHGAWPKTDAFLKTVVQSWQVMARELGSVGELIIGGIFPWCFTPELYAEKPDYIETLANFVRSRPEQPVPAFMQQSNAVLAHNVEALLDRIAAPTQLTFGRNDQLTSTRFADPLTSRIRDAEVLVFEGCSHAPLYENVAEFNERTLQFLQRHAVAAVA